MCTDITDAPALVPDAGAALAQGAMHGLVDAGAAVSAISRFWSPPVMKIPSAS
ncbi:MAG: hypothetical protein H0W40_18380 [Methylibium sp.]|nr:hypothetical protein [Methylibium sp.]